MKKIYLFIALLFFAFVSMAQVIDSKKESVFYSIVSPNARFYVSTKEGGDAFRYDIETKETISSLFSEGDFGFKANAVTNDGVVAGAFEWQAVLWYADEDYEYLPLPNDLDSVNASSHEVIAITPDGKRLVVHFNASSSYRDVNYVYTKQEDGTWNMDLLPIPESEPIFGKKYQRVGAIDISVDGNTILGSFIVDDGWDEFPFVWRNNNGVWNVEFFGKEIILKEGKVMPPYPYEDIIIDPETGDEYIPIDVWDEYTTIKDSVVTNYSFVTYANKSISGNGKYVTIPLRFTDVSGEVPVEIKYAAVYDLEQSRCVVFSTLEDAVALSVNNNGEVIIATPAKDEFRWSYVASIDNPTKIQTLTEWVKNRTNGVVDLAEYMQYQLEEETTIAEGTAYWAKEGKGLVTYQLNVLGTGMYESYFLRFDVESANRPTYSDSQIGVYPNPTSGMLNLSKAMTNVAIYDVTGRKVYAQSVVEETIDLSALHAGQYFLVATVDGEHYSTKLLIQK